MAVAIYLRAFLLLACLTLIAGKEFAKVTVGTSLTALEVTAVKYLTSTEVVVVGNNLNGGTTTGYVFRSTDSGVTFTQVHSDVDGTSANHFIGLGTRINGGTTYYITASNAGQIFLALSSAINTWSAISTNTPVATTAIYGVTIGSSGTAYIAGASNVVKRAAGTAYTTWTTLTPANNAGGTPDWYDVSSFDGTALIVVGTSGKISYSANSGSNWFNSAATQTTSSIYCVAHATSSFAVAAGADGYLAKSSNGGNSWTAMTAFGAGYTAQYHSLSIVSATDAYVAAFDGSTGSIIYVTTTLSGVSTWSALASTTQTLHSLGMFSSSFGTAGAIDGEGVISLVNSKPPQCAVFVAHAFVASTNRSAVLEPINAA